MGRYNHSRRLTVALTIAVFAVILSTIAIMIAFRALTQRTDHVYTAVPEEDFQDATFESHDRWYGLCRKNSVHSVDDFLRIVSKDPLLKVHFAAFKWENAQMGKLDKAILAYVNFRKEGKIFLKGKPIRLPANDEFITDGNIQVRTHCCNDYMPGPPLRESPEPPIEMSSDAPAQISAAEPAVQQSAAPPAQQSVESPRIKIPRKTLFAFDFNSTPGGSQEKMPIPGQTPVPEPGQAPAPEPGETPAPEPGETPAPEPGQTPIPEPGETPVPEPGQTPVPEPGETPVPEPGEAPAPEPGQTPIPEPGTVLLVGSGFLAVFIARYFLRKGK